MAGKDANKYNLSSQENFDEIIKNFENKFEQLELKLQNIKTNSYQNNLKLNSVKVRLNTIIDNYETYQQCIINYNEALEKIKRLKARLEQQKASFD
jgi:hypothetical protein